MQSYAGGNRSVHAGGDQGRGPHACTFSVTRLGSLGMMMRGRHISDQAFQYFCTATGHSRMCSVEPLGVMVASLGHRGWR